MRIIRGMVSDKPEILKMIIHERSTRMRSGVSLYKCILTKLKVTGFLMIILCAVCFFGKSGYAAEIDYADDNDYVAEKETAEPDELTAEENEVVLSSESAQNSVIVEEESDNEESVDEESVDEESVPESIALTGTPGEEFVVSKYYTYRINSDGQTVTFVKNSNPGDVSVPEKVTYGGNEYTVTAIGDYAFDYHTNTSPDSLTIPKTVTKIGSYAFRRSSVSWGFYEGIKILGTIEEADAHAFQDTVLWDFPKFSDDYTCMNDYLFYNTGFGHTTHIVIPQSVKSIGEYAFCETGVEESDKSHRVLSIELSNGLESIGKAAFKDCTELQSMIIPDSVTDIGNAAFCGCTRLRSITIPISASIEARGDVGNSTVNALSGCPIAWVYLSKGTGAWNIVNGGFRPWDKWLKDSESFGGKFELILNDGITSIPERAFSQGDHILSITLPDSIESIGDYAFWHCNFNGSSTNVFFGKGLKSIGAYAFAGTKVVTGSTTIDGKRYASLTLPDTITSIGDGAFAEFSWRVVVWDTAETNSYGTGIFEGSTILDHVFFNGSKKVIPASSFKNCKNLTDVSISESVVEIGSCAFFCCTSLSYITLPNAVTKIGTRAFWGCTNLSDISIPETVAAIGDEAFYGCNMGFIKLSEDLSNIGTDAFKNNENLFVIGKPGSYVNEYMNRYGIPFAGISVSLNKSNLDVGESMDIPFTCVYPEQYNLHVELLSDNGQSTYNGKAALDISGVTDEASHVRITALYEGIIGLSFEIQSDEQESVSLAKKELTINHKDNATFKIEFLNGISTDYDLEITPGHYQVGKPFGEMPDIPNKLTSDERKYDPVGWYTLSQGKGKLITKDTILDGSLLENCIYDGSIQEGSYSVVKLYAYGKLHNCVVSFDMNDHGTPVENQSVQSGEALYVYDNNPNIQNPISEDGYVFGGWYTDEKLEKGWVEGTVIYDDAILYAKWELHEAEGFRIEGVNDLTYDGTNQTQNISVYDGLIKLVPGKDYTVKYTNNKKAYTLSENDAGFYNSKGKTSAPTITITGKGNYSNKSVIYFKINPVDISLINPDVFCDEISIAYNSKKWQSPIPALYWNGKALKNKNDYSIAYYEIPDGEEFNPEAPGRAMSAVKDPGNYIIRITGKENFAGTRDIPLSIISDTSGIKLISKLSFSKIADQKYAGGEPVCPAVTVNDGHVTLIPDTDSSYEDYDYTITYTNNTAVGTGYAVIKGNPESGYSGTKRIPFKIKGISLKKAAISGLPSSVVYTGNSITFDDKILDGDLTITAKGQHTVLAPYDPVDGSGDYKLIYKDNCEAGKATITFLGINGCTDSVSKTFKITPFVVTNDPSDMFTVSLDDTTYPYAKAGARPVPVVKYRGVLLTEGKDYTLSYANNTSMNDGSGSKVPTVKVKGKGNFKGTDQTATFKISQADMASTGVVVVAKDVVIQNKPGKWMPKYSVVGPDGKALKGGKDYDNKNVLYTYDEAGTEAVKAMDIVPVGTTIYVKVNAKGTLYSGSATGSYRVVQNDIGKLSVTLDPKTYTGKAITVSPSDLTWKSGKKKVEGVTFEIDETSYKNNINKGKATVVVKGTGNYGGTKKITFTIGAKGILWWWRNMTN